MVTDSIIIIIVYFTKAATYVLICSCFGEINDDDDNTLSFPSEYVNVNLNYESIMTYVSSNRL